MELDELLDAARPGVTPTSAALLNDLSALAEATRQAPRKRSMAARISAGIAGVAVLGLAGTAAAGGLPPFGWTSDSGRECSIIHASVELAGGSDNESRDGFAATTPEERARTLQEAQQFLANYDFDSVDREAAAERFQREESEAIAAQPDPAERQPRLTGDELEVHALLRQQARDLVAHLEEMGYRSDVVLLVQGYTGEMLPDGEWECGE